MMVNYGETIESIAHRVIEVNGASSLSKGRQIYPEIEGQADHKYIFYIEFLRCIENWANCMPNNNYISPQDKSKNIEAPEAETSKVKELFDLLKTEKSFIFPENPFIAKFKKEHQANYEANQERNEFILVQLNEDDTNSKYIRSSLRKSKKMSERYSTHRISLIR